MIFRILIALINDRVIQAGTGTSGVSIVGAAGIGKHPLASATLDNVQPWLAGAQPWIALFAALFGGLSAAATFIYVCIKIRRLIQNPQARE